MKKTKRCVASTLAVTLLGIGLLGSSTTAPAQADTSWGGYSSTTSTPDVDQIVSARPDTSWGGASIVSVGGAA